MGGAEDGIAATGVEEAGEGECKDELDEFGGEGVAVEGESGDEGAGGRVECVPEDLMPPVAPPAGESGGEDGGKTAKGVGIHPCFRADVSVDGGEMAEETDEEERSEREDRLEEGVDGEETDEGTVDAKWDDRLPEECWDVCWCWLVDESVEVRVFHKEDLEAV